MLYFTLKALFVQKNYLSIFTDKTKYRLLLYSAYNNKNDDNCHLNFYTKLFITSTHLNLINLLLIDKFEKKKAFPSLVSHSIKNDIIKEIDKKEEKKDNDGFPLKIIGNVEKKGRLLGLSNPRYLELDSVNGLIKRYKSTDDYPEKPK